MSDESVAAAMCYPFPSLMCDSAEREDEYAIIKVNKKKYTIGRSLSNDFSIPIISVSRQHCTLELKQSWTISDHSSSGTQVNGLYIKKGEEVELNDGDKISFGGKTYRFISWQEEDPPHKKRKLKTPNNAKESNFFERTMKEEIERLEAKHAAEKASLEAVLQAEALKQEELKKEKERMEEILNNEKKNTKALLEKENKLSSKLQEMEQKLTEQESAHEEIKQKLMDKEEQRIRDLKYLREKQEAETKAALEELKTKLNEKENTLRSTLQNNMSSLQSERNVLEESIKLELKKEDESNENLRKLKEELDRVKKELESVEGKKILLETELQNVNNTNKEVSSENELRAKEDILSNFGTLMESELQCSICNELFVRANTLNCTHTFCQFCIGEWRKKKNECPVCRAKITSQNRSIALDNFIDKMVENLTQDMKNRRQEIVEERAVHEIMDKRKTPKKTTPDRPRRSVRTGNHGRRHAGASTSNNASIVVISDDSSSIDSESSSDFSSENTSNDSDEDVEWSETDDNESFEFDSASDRPRIAGIRGAYYGGYGHCFKCGAVGHWANGCPSRL